MHPSQRANRAGSVPDMFLFFHTLKLRIKIGEVSRWETEKMSAEDVPVVRSVYDSQPWLSRPSTVNGVRELEGDSRNFQRALAPFFSSSSISPLRCDSLNRMP